VSHTDKEFYMAREIGLLRGTVVQLESSNAHYRELVGERTKALHGYKRELRKLKRQLKGSK
jgi:hypothetical protein